jgi:hypothetical protein
MSEGNRTSALETVDFDPGGGIPRAPLCGASGPRVARGDFDHGVLADYAS